MANWATIQDRGAAHYTARLHRRIASMDRYRRRRDRKIGEWLGYNFDLTVTDELNQRRVIRLEMNGWHPGKHLIHFNASHIDGMPLRPWQPWTMDSDKFWRYGREGRLVKV